MLPSRWWTNDPKEQECNFCISTKTTDKEGSYVMEVYQWLFKKTMTVIAMHIIMYFEKKKSSMTVILKNSFACPIWKKDTIFKSDSKIKGYKTKDKADASAKENWLVLQIRKEILRKQPQFEFLLSENDLVF